MRTRPPYYREKVGPVETGEALVRTIRHSVDFSRGECIDEENMASWRGRLMRASRALHVGDLGITR